MSTIQTPPQPAPSARAGSDTKDSGVVAPQGDRLPSVRFSLSGAEVLERLRTASKRGRLAGFEAGQAETGFIVAAHGNPFDAQLHGRIDGGFVRFDLKPLHRLPIIFAIILIATVWPGVHFMDALIPGEWGWIPTWWWYLPVTALPIPWVWRNMQRRSRAAVLASAQEAIRKIAKEVDGTVE